MKPLRSSLTALLLLIPLAVATASPAAYTLQVDGLACPFCAYGIEKKLISIEGVEKIDVDIKNGQVVVTMAEGTQLSQRLAREKVKEAGFTLRAFAEVPGAQ